MTMDDWVELNRANWDERAAAHAASPDYAFEQFATDPTYLSAEVRFDLPRLGAVDGLRGVHLQCHIGTDTVSLARLGAQMTGLDFSVPALEQARALAARAGAEVEWVHAEFHDTPNVLPEASFDFVYTGIGAICWLPRIAEWAQVVSGLLKPGGRLFIREGHPMLWTLDDARDDDLLVVRHPYFEPDEPNIWDEDGTYVETDAEFTATKTAEWSHGLGEIVTAVLGAGLRITGLEEHDSAPWPPLAEHVLERDPEFGEFRLREGRERLPFTYTLQAVND